MWTAARSRRLMIGTGVLFGFGLAACSPENVVGNAKLPPDIPDPGVVQTPAGAVAAYHGTEVAFRDAFGGRDARPFIVAAGELADELGGFSGPIGTFAEWTYEDSRTLPEAQDPSFEPAASYITVYANLQAVRGKASQARGLLTHYAPDSLAPLSGHLYALQGYAETFLADLFCSGIPLSTIDFDGDYTLEPGSTTSEVYQHAVSLFDSAITLVGDSARLLNLARVGKARAHLDLGQYADAARDVADVPDDFQYTVTYRNQFGDRNFAYFDARTTGLIGTVADREGGNGLDYVSGGDPRTASVIAMTDLYGNTLYRPTKYAVTGDTPLVLASGVEARLIEAEAQLQAGDVSGALATLDRLRTDGTYDTRPDPADSTKTDTLWHAGTGGVAGLAPLADPGTPEGRVDLVFHERAFWLFLTGQRQGDLRRLIRQYGRNPDSVYPSGSYEGASGGYGADVNAPIPASERTYNSRFHGCTSRGA